MPHSCSPHVLQVWHISEALDLLVRAALNAPAADSWEAPASQMVEKLPAPESLKSICSPKKNRLLSKKGLAETGAALVLCGGLVRWSRIASLCLSLTNVTVSPGV